MKEKIVIIGGGVAGLAAGIYAQMNHYDSCIYEQNLNVGGECTAWRRKGYTIDGSISWLTGTGKDTDINRVWLEVGAFTNDSIIFSNEFAVVTMDGKKLYWYRDINKLRANLLDISREDAEEIERMVYIIDRLKAVEMPADKPLDLMKPAETALFINKFMKCFHCLGNIGGMTMEEYVERFHSKLIREALKSFSFANNLTQGFFFTVSAIASCQAGWPLGGSGGLTHNMLQRYLKLGGQVFCNKRVGKIITEGTGTTGVMLEENAFIPADYVIPACDVHVTMKKLLNDQYRDIIFDRYYSETQNYRTSSICQITFGVDCDLSGYPEKSIFIFEPVSLAGEVFNNCIFTHYCYESTFAPEGKSVIKTGFIVYDYDNWKDMTEEDYRDRKEEISEVFTNKLFEYFPETRGKIEMTDITTPLTYERYCGAYKGSYMAFMLTKTTNRVSHTGRIKGIGNLYIASQWLSVLGGLPDTVLSGKFAIQRLCHDKGRSFAGVE